MFKDDNMQYVNIKQYDKQLKIDNQILKNDKIVKTENSSFLIENNLSTDCISKLNILQKNINKTYLTTICESLNQKVVKADEFFDTAFEIRKLNATYNIAIPKEDLINKQQYFKNTGLDYIFSPFNILYNHIIANTPNTNSLNMLILNNIIYALILDDEKRIVHSTMKTLTAFDDIQDSQFTGDDLDGQKLFDEMHALEIQDSITAIMNEFYEQSPNKIFCESVAIFYTLKQLTNEQLDTIKDAIMLEIEYSSLNFNDYLFNLSKQSNVSRISFILPREKKNPKSFALWLFGAVITTALVGGVLYYMQIQKAAKEEKIIQEEKAKKIAQEKAKLAQIKLPNHKMENAKLSKIILSIFDIIPYSAVLSELQLQKKDSTFVCSLLKKDVFKKDIQPKLLKLYKTSEILLIQNNKPTYNAIIANNGLLPQKLSTKQVQPDYRKNKFIAKSTLIEQIQAFLPKKSKVIFKSKYKSKFLTYNFNVTTTLQEPQEFFKFIEELNKKSYCIQIKYPIEFAQTKKGLETSFNLQFHQFHKK